MSQLLLIIVTRISFCWAALDSFKCLISLSTSLMETFSKGNCHARINQSLIFVILGWFSKFLIAFEIESLSFTVIVLHKISRFLSLWVQVSSKNSWRCCCNDWFKWTWILPREEYYRQGVNLEMLVKPVFGVKQKNVTGVFVNDYLCLNGSLVKANRH